MSGAAPFVYSKEGERMPAKTYYGGQAVVDGVYKKLQEHSVHQVQSDDITLIAIEKR